MPEAVQTSDKGATRKLRAHKKSRRGCGNCKLRAIKCDETTPICKRCKAYGVVCNYDKKSSDLEMSFNGVFQVSILNDSPPPMKSAVPKSIAPGLKQGLAASLESIASHDLGNSEFELLHRFQTRTVYTLTTPRSLPIYQSSILKYACSVRAFALSLFQLTSLQHPYLLHAVMTLTLLHDRHFSTTPLDSTLTATEAYHWGRSITLYRRAISVPIRPASRDALWATAAFLGILAITYVEARTPEESWPYAPPSSLDLNWLGMSEGKKEIWKDGKAFMEESDFRILAIEQQGNYSPSPVFGNQEGLESLPPGFVEYYGFTEPQLMADNPYYASAFTLAQTWNAPKFTVVLNFLFYFTAMPPQYKPLLKQKDRRALLLLAYWWRMVAETRHWFFFRRAFLECESICMYLERFYGGDQELPSLLEFLKGISILKSI